MTAITILLAASTWSGWWIGVAAFVGLIAMGVGLGCLMIWMDRR